MLRKLQDIKKRSEGFTIVEVMIVLAIAGLIMLIVFLALPALQRNSRNTQRNNDASRIVTAATECLNNRNGLVASCMSAANINFQSTEMGQLATTPTFANGGTTAPTTSTTGAGIWYGRTCLADGTASQPGTGRQFVVLFSLEPAITRCIAGS